MHQLYWSTILLDKTNLYSLQGNKQSRGNGMDTICPYKSISKLSLYISTKGLTRNLNNVQYAKWDNSLFISNLSF